MKHFTLLAALILTAATSAFATGHERITQHLDRHNLSRHTALTQRASAERLARTADVTSARKAKASASRAAAITRQPAGTLYANVMASYAGLAYSWLGGFYDSSSDASAMDIVEGTDGNIYIRGLAPELSTTRDYWVKAEPDGEGYVIKRQPIGEYEGYYSTTVYYVARMVYDEQEGFVEEDSNTDIHVTYANGVLCTSAEMADGDVAYGIVYYDDEDAEWYWDGSAYWALSTAVQTDVYAVAPEGSEVEQRVLMYKSGGESYIQTVDFVQAGDKVYLHPYDDVPGWIVGTVDGDSITVASGQYLGVDENYGRHSYLHVSQTALTLNEDEPDYPYWYDKLVEMLDYEVFAIDTATGTITGTHTLTIDASKNDFYSIALYNEPSISIFHEVAACPADPEVTFFYNYDNDYGYGLVDFHIPTTDVNGEYITPSKLSYVVYFDDTSEAFEFDTDDYENFEEAMTEIPYDFTDDWDIYDYAGDKEVSFYFTIAQLVGVQSIYRGAGEEHKSNIVVYYVNTGESATIAVDDPLSSVRSATVKSVATESLTDIAGRSVGANARGLLIKTVTFADGTQHSYKLLRK